MEQVTRWKLGRDWCSTQRRMAGIRISSAAVISPAISTFCGLNRLTVMSDGAAQVFPTFSITLRASSSSARAACTPPGW